MEFDKNTHTPDDQILDSTSKLVVNPLSLEDQIVAEENTTQIANAHANGAAIGNISSDTEVTGNQTVAPVASAEQQAVQLLAAHKAANPTKKTKFPASIIVVLMMIGILLFALLYK